MIADVILVIGWIIAIQAIRSCVDSIGAAAVASLSAAGLIALVACFSAGTSARTGGPTR